MLRFEVRSIVQRVIENMPFLGDFDIFDRRCLALTLLKIVGIRSAVVDNFT
jgi:hypothetical protein